MNPMRHWKIIATLAGIVLVSFAAGFMTGFQSKQVKLERRFDPAQWNVYAMNTLQRKLDLSPDQQVRIQTIIDQTVDEMKTLHQGTVEQTSQIVHRMLDAVGKELTPEQREIAKTLSPSSDEVTIDLLKVSPKED